MGPSNWLSYQLKMYPQERIFHHFREIKVDDYWSVKGPKDRFKYQVVQVRAFGMLAGGSGITPIFQVARAILENPIDNTKVHLMYALDHMKLWITKWLVDWNKS